MGRWDYVLDGHFIALLFLVSGVGMKECVDLLLECSVLDELFNEYGLDIQSSLVRVPCSIRS